MGGISIVVLRVIKFIVLLRISLRYFRWFFVHVLLHIVSTCQMFGLFVLDSAFDVTSITNKILPDGFVEQDHFFAYIFILGPHYSLSL